MRKKTGGCARGFCGLNTRSPLRTLVKFMSNRAIWNVRRRHEWLATPLKGKRIKRSVRVRCGLQDALDRKAAKEKTG